MRPRPRVPVGSRGDAAERAALRRGTEAGKYIALGLNSYVLADEWRGLDRFAQIRLRHVASAYGREGHILLGKSAALFHRLDALVDETTPIEVGHRGTRSTRITADTIHRYVCWDPGSVVQSGGLSVATPGQMIADIAKWHSKYDALIAADSALRLRHGRAQLLGDGTRVADRRPLMVQVMAMADGTSESAGESWGRGQLIDAGITELSPQMWVFDESKILVGRVDIMIPSALVAVEFHGMGKYQGMYGDAEDRFDQEWGRETGLLRVGLGVARVNWSDIVEGRVAEVVRSAIEAREKRKDLRFSGHMIPKGVKWPEGFMTRNRARGAGLI